MVKLKRKEKTMFVSHKGISTGISVCNLFYFIIRHMSKCSRILNEKKQNDLDMFIVNQ